MGVQKTQVTSRQDKPKGSGSGVNWSQLGAASAGGGVDWSDADGALVARLIHSATRRGMAVSFSATANGKGVSITILDGGDRPKWYANTPEELDDLLNRLDDLVRET